MHHPIQVCRLLWNFVYCTDAQAARASRKWALDHLADRHALYFSSRFTGTSAGHETRTGDRFAWQFR